MAESKKPATASVMPWATMPCAVALVESVSLATTTCGTTSTTPRWQRALDRSGRSDSSSLGKTVALLMCCSPTGLLGRTLQWT